jgi:restriction system protein
LLETRTDLDSLAANGWRDFERLVGEAFRRQGYAVEETGLGGADGGMENTGQSRLSRLAHHIVC